MCNEIASSSIELNTSSNIKLIEADVKAALNGEQPHLIDEWQKVPEIWNAIKDDLDKNYVFGKYMITGSTTPPNANKIQHSGAGRISTMMLKPFSLFESGDSNGRISIKNLFAKPNQKLQTILSEDNKCSLSNIAYFICRGGWPISVISQKEYSIEVTKNYFKGLFRIESESDEFAEFLKNKDIALIKLIMKSYARNISTKCKKTKMVNDILSSGERTSLDIDTFNSYSKIVHDLFIIFDLPSWKLNLRSSVAVRTAPTHHFVDPSIAAASLNISPGDLLNDMNSFGLFFEDLAIRDLSIYAQANNLSLKHYRDSSGQEVDDIIEAQDGTFGAIEIKIASEKNIAEGIKSLQAFNRKLEKAILRYQSLMLS